VPLESLADYKGDALVKGIRDLVRREKPIVVSELDRLHRQFPGIRLNWRMLEAFLNPPGRPDNCGFARLTHTVSADLKSPIEPCQFGGTPDCSQCGCLATMGLEAVLNYRLPVGVRVRTFFDASMAVGETVRRVRPDRLIRLGDRGKRPTLGTTEG
jgi:hypothetical protein